VVRGNGVTPDEDGKLFLMRKITADGKNACRVNGCPVSVAQLRELGGLLIDIHGQNDGRKLLDENAHRGYLDSFAGLDGPLNTYREAYKKLRDKQVEIEKLTMDESEKERKLDMLRFQLDELERAGIKPGEFDEKTARRDLLKNASKLTEALDGALRSLRGGDDADGAVTLIAAAEQRVASAGRYSDSFGPLAERLRDLLFAAEDVSEELRDTLNSLDFSPGELDSLEARLDALRRLMRKYGDGEAALIEHREKCRRELEEIEFASDRLLQFEKELDGLKADALAKARLLSEKRRMAAAKLERRIREELGGLSMAGVSFEVEFGPARGEIGLNDAGCDEIRFLMSANAGEAPGRIKNIASGGELSRIMLALKNVLTENDEAATMVFDEVDAGVSGVAAQRVGEKLSDVSRSRQVLCVTHLMQIAVMADTHFEVEKRTQDGRTFTYVVELDEEGRKHEIARLTGGENVTDTTLLSAAEQLEASARYKAKRKN
jgi:DNA repair protein RecN (Recombination protein N)